MKRYALPALLLVNGALAVWLAWMWFTPQGALRNVRWQPPAVQQTDLSSRYRPLYGVAGAPVVLVYTPPSATSTSATCCCSGGQPQHRPPVRGI